MMPKRIQRKRTKGWKMPEGAVYVGRPTRWGNPFIVGVHGDAGECLAKFRECLKGFPSPVGMRAWCDAGGNSTMWVVLAGGVDACLEMLRGQDLACWCPLDRPCHADVLLEIASKFPSPAPPKEHD